MPASEPAGRASTSTIEEHCHDGQEIKDEKVVAVSRAGAVEDPFLVTFPPGDKENPKNWSQSYRWYLTIASGILVLNGTLASTAPSNALPVMMEYFGFGQEVATLTVSLFTAGYCVGPILWGPLSEQIGRRPVFIWTFVIYTGFQVGSALSKNTASILVFRFLGGIFAAAPLTNSGAVVGDIWDAKTRGKPMVLFAIAGFVGPALGPVFAGWIIVAGVTWRWVFWVLTLFAGACLAMVVLTLPETYGPTLLVKRAKKLRKDTGDDRYYAQFELHNITLRETVVNVVAKPFKMLFLEPMLLACTIYISFISGCMYLLFEAYPVVFSEGHHMNPGVSGLMFLPVSIGGGMAVVVYLLYFEPRYERYAEQNAPNLVPPEARLEITMLGGPIFAISFFWFGWTSYPSISFWSPSLAGGLMGMGIFYIFLSLFNFVVDTYLFAAASALAAMTVVRSISSATFPLFAHQMYVSLNPRWASTLLGFIAMLMVPIPFVFTKYGAVLRAKSKYVPHIPRRG